MDPHFNYENFREKYFKVNAGNVITPNYDDCNLETTFTIDKKSINKGTASIDSKTGEITANKYGTVTVTALVGEGKYARKTTTKVRVYDPVINTGKKASVMVGKTLKASVKNGVKTTTDWKTSNEDIATVDDRGRIKGVSVGTVRISCVNNGKTISKEITVIDTHFDANLKW